MGPRLRLIVDHAGSPIPPNEKCTRTTLGLSDFAPRGAAIGSLPCVRLLGQPPQGSIIDRKIVLLRRGKYRIRPETPSSGSLLAR